MSTLTPDEQQVAPQKTLNVGTVDMDEARERGRLADEYWRKQYPTMQNDLQFLAGNQWNPQDKQARTTARRLAITVNDLGQYLDQIVGDFRQNPTSIQVIPSDLGAVKAKFKSNTGREYDGAEVKMGLIRQIEYKSSASDHYNLAGQHAAEAGLGFLRVYSDYCGIQSFNQDIKIERIKNRFSVMLDPMATEPDGSDANYGFIGDWMPRKEFLKKHPNANPTPIGDAYMNYWGKEAFVRVTEYYWRELIKVEIAMLDNGTVITDGADKATDEMKASAAKIWDLVVNNSNRVVKRRTAYSYRVMWAKITYHDVLEGPVVLPGTIIPIVPVYGKRIEGDEDTLHYGLVRFAKEPKQMENYWLTAGTETIALQTKSPWLVTDEQIEGYENEWAEANTGNKPYLPYNHINGQPAPQRIMPPTLPAGALGMMSTMREIVKGSIGLHDAAIGKGTDQQSGRALLALEHSADVGNFVFSDNLRMAVSYVGRVLLEWISVVYDAERFITIRHENGEVDTIEINRIEPDGTLTNDISQGSYDQHVTTGPAYSTLRQQAAQTQMELYKAVPELVPVTIDIALANMDWPGAQQMAKRARKMVPKQLLDESELTQEEQAAAEQPPQPTPQDQLAEAAMQLEAKNIEAEGATADAKIATAEAAKATAAATTIRAEADIAATHESVLMNKQNVITDALARDDERADRKELLAAAKKPGTASLAEEPAPAPSGDSAPVSRADLEALKSELAQTIAQTVMQLMRGPSQNV